MTTSEGAKTALVTGGNRGIGREVCRQLAAREYTVIVGARRLEAGEAVAKEIGASATALPLDVTSDADVNAAVEMVRTRFGRLDALVNNAGIDYDTDQRVLIADLDRVRTVWETNTLGVWRMVQAFAPLFQAGGRIVNVSSQSGQLSSLGAGTPAYSHSKVALNGLTIMLAAALGPRGILVNAVCPGWVATDMGGSGGRPVEDGAASVVWAVTLPDDGPNGGFFRDGQRLEW